MRTRLLVALAVVVTLAAVGLFVASIVFGYVACFTHGHDPYSDAAALSFFSSIAVAGLAYGAWSFAAEVAS